jgi:hypothetical protein
MRKPLMIATGVFLATAAPLSGAHHGFATHYYPDQYITIEGTVKQFDFVNPHAILYIDGTNDAGEPVVYTCALQARTQLVRRGVSDDLFTVGAPIRVDGFAARRDPYGCEFGTSYFTDGSSFTMRSQEGRTVFAENEARPVPTSASGTGSIFGNWIRPTLYGPAGGGSMGSGQDSITAAGQAAQDAFDPIAGNPVIRCEGGSPIRNWGAPGLATRITQVNSEIFIYHESMDITRTVHMNLTEHPDDAERTDMGHSIGRFEDGTLVIDSAAFAAGVLGFSTVHTADMTMTERLRVVPDTGDLEITWVVLDEAFYDEPITGGQTLQSTTQEIIRYECIPEALPETL